MIIKLRVALTLIGLVAIMLVIHLLTSGLGHSGRVRIPTGAAQTSAAPATTSESRYGLQVGLYLNKSQAQTMAARVDGAVFGVVDSGGTNWWMAVAGPYTSPQAAQAHSTAVAARANARVPSLPVIKWPEPAR